MTGDYYLCLLVLGEEKAVEESLDYDDQSKFSQLLVYALVAKGACTKEQHLLDRAAKLLELSPVAAR